jgi:plastocyanin
VLCGAAALLLLGSAPPAREHRIEIANMRFGPVPAGLKAGDTILWVNRDVVVHSATARDRSFDVTVPPGRSARTIVRRAGRIPFTCRFHSGMQGMLVAG